VNAQPRAAASQSLQGVGAYSALRILRPRCCRGAQQLRKR